MEYNPPVTLQAQRAPSVSNEESSISYLSPAYGYRLGILKNQAAQISNQGSPKDVKGFLKWRLELVSTQIDIAQLMGDGLKNSPSFQDNVLHEEIQTRGIIEQETC